MAASDESSGKAGKAPSGTARNKKKQPADGPVVPSAPVAPGDMSVSRIPPSRPVESGLVGQGGTVPAAARKPAKGDTSTAKAAEKPASDSGKRPDTDGKAPAAAAVASAAHGTAPAAPAPVQAVTVRRTGFWPVALGGVVAAGLGAAATIWALPHLPQSMLPPRGEQVDPDALLAEAARAASDAAEARIAALRDEIAVSAGSAATEAGATAGAEAARGILSELPPAAPGQPGQSDDTELRAALQAQAERIAALENAPAAVPAAPAPPAAGGAVPAQDAGAGIAALNRRIEEQARSIAELSARPQVDPEQLAQLQSLADDIAQTRAGIDEAAARAQQSLSAVQAEAEAATRRAQSVASVAALGAALERGGPAVDAVQQLQDAGVDIPAPLTQGDLPTLDQIQAAYDEAARAALRAALRADSPESGAVGAIGNFLRVQTGARSVAPREGSDPDAVLSRAGALVAKGDLGPALTELDALPPAGAEAMAGWRAQAEARLAAEAALNDVAQSLN
ncbi:MAG: hypothetical protein Q4G25_10355 [Paracoccus sp. (in: a-proteobacteria)]|nr:hypothetical protein [Paracoccus sp. (in: a-proteobacteria)]